MFLKTITTFIVSTIFGFGATSTRVYVAPKPKAIDPAPVSTTTNISIVTKTATSTPKTIVATSTKPKKKVVPKKITANSTPVQKPKQEIQKIDIASLPPLDYEKVNTYSRQAIVNILCSTKGGELSPISGTGVVINPKGIIITNAHIGQYFLLKDYKEKDYVGCVIRTGSPAYPTYKAELMYISTTWVGNNKSILKSQDPKGTGENDFAFLHIIGKVDDGNLPESFQYLIPDVREVVQTGEPVLLVSYPAGFLGGLTVIQDLNITSSLTKVKDLFTFKQNTIDLIDVGGTVVSQKGSSGGAVVDYFVSLLGIITTSSEGNTTDKRDLHAITLAHVNRSLQSELGINLNGVLSQDPKEFSKTFASTTAPLLSKLITDELNKQ